MRNLTGRALLREPLLHFLLAGLALFAVYGRASPGDNDTRIVITRGQIEDMARQYQSAFNRPPTRAEMSGLIETYVRDEISYREGLVMGLDKDDPVIKRRVRQKYHLIAEEEQRTDPTDAELVAFLRANATKFALPGVVSFEQVFFDPATTTPEAVEAVRVKLAKGADATKFGQPSMLPVQVANRSLELVERDFGDSFAQSVAVSPIGSWSHPIASGFGVHLIRVSARSAPVVPPLGEVRASVAREWESDQRRRSGDASYRKARSQYEVVVEAKLP